MDPSYVIITDNGSADLAVESIKNGHWISQGSFWSLI